MSVWRRSDHCRVIQGIHVIVTSTSNHALDQMLKLLVVIIINEPNKESRSHLRLAWPYPNIPRQLASPACGGALKDSVDCMHLQIYTRALAAACASQGLVVLVVVAPIEGQSRAVLPLLLSQWLRRVRGLHRIVLFVCVLPCCCSVMRSCNQCHSSTGWM